jgi:hypothetical protein
MDRTRLIEFLAARIKDPRSGRLITYSLEVLLRTCLFLLVLGYRDQDDADSLRHDPVLRLCISDHRGLTPLAEASASPPPRNPLVPLGLPSQPSMARFMAMVAVPSAIRALREALTWLACLSFKARHPNSTAHVYIDLDSIPVEVEGHQEGSEYNGHYRANIFHPLVAIIGESGDLVDLQLRNGAVPTAEKAKEFILLVVERLRRNGVEAILCIRLDAGFPCEALLFALEQAGIRYVARIRHHTVMDAIAAPFLAKADARRNGALQEWAEDASYKAKSWSRERRAVVVFVDDGPKEVMLNWFWVLTNWTVAEQSAEEVFRSYRRRGKAEGHFGELSDTIGLKLSSANRPKSHYKGKAPKKKAEKPKTEPFARNEALLLLNGLSYQLLHMLRPLPMPEPVTVTPPEPVESEEAPKAPGWGLKRVRDEALKGCGRVVVHARRATLQLSQELETLRCWIWTGLARLAMPD